MNMPIEKNGLSISTISVSQVNRAKAIANQTKQALLDVLEEESRLNADDFVTALGQLMYYPAFSMLALYEMTPDFASLSFAEASKYGCVALCNHDNRLYLIHANPFDSHLQGKIDLIISDLIAREKCIWGICHAKDLSAFLAHIETTMRAMDGITSDHINSQATQSGIEDISLRSISEDTSPVVKFVRSTLYDALKSGASDVHMETDPHDLTVKYRIDGVLSKEGGIQGIAQAE